MVVKSNKIKNDLIKKNISKRILNVTQPYPQDIIDLILDSILSEEDNGFIDDFVIRHLCLAYVEAFKAQAIENKWNIQMIKGHDAEILFKDLAYEAFIIELPDTLRDAESIPSLPDCIPRDIDLPLDMVRQMATIIGFNEGVRARVLLDYYLHYAVKGEN